MSCACVPGARHFAQTSYVLPEDKTTKNSGNGEMPLPAGADGRMVGTPEGGNATGRRLHGRIAG